MPRDLHSRRVLNRLGPKLEWSTEPSGTHSHQKYRKKILVLCRQYNTIGEAANRVALNLSYTTQI